jgi:hypothetical protein
MFDPSGITLGQISSSVRDFAIVGVLISLSWKARGAYEAVTQFFTRTMKHMDVMEAGMTTLLTNHLAHIETSLDKMSNNQERVLSGNEAIHVIEEEASGT